MLAFLSGLSDSVHWRIPYLLRAEIAIVVLLIGVSFFHKNMNDVIDPAHEALDALKKQICQTIMKQLSGGQNNA